MGYGIEGDGLVWCVGGAFPREGFQKGPEAGGMVFVRARLDRVYPFFSVGVRYVLCDVLVEDAYVWVCWVCGT